MQIKNVRFIIAAITTFSAYAVYVSRINLSIAIIAMVEDGHQNATGDALFADHNSAPRPANSTATTPLNLSVIDANNRTSAWPPQAGRPASNAAAANQTSSSPVVGSRVAFAGMASKEAILKPPLIRQRKFHWDQTEQGHIMGAFFYGYILFQIPGARMAELVGARWILMTSVAGSALISLVFPLSTQLDSIHLLMVLRFVMGLCQSAFFPAAYVFFCRWLPESERSVLLPIMFIGSNMGSISTFIMSSYLTSSSYGWPSVFYVSGMICLAVTLLWCVFGSNGPQDNWLITDEERDYILDNIDSAGRPLARAQRRPAEVAAVAAPKIGCTASYAPRRASISKSKSAGDLYPNQAFVNFAALHPEVVMLDSGANLKQAGLLARDGRGAGSGALVANGRAGDAPAQLQEGRQLSWCKLLSSVPVWTLIFSMYGNEWSQVVLSYVLPTYLSKALNISIEQNGVINSFLQLSFTIASPILSSLGAYALDKHLFGMRKIHVRKVFQSVALFGQLACYASVPICGPNRSLIIMFMFSAIVFKACANAGDIMVSGDLSPEFAGTIFALANAVGNTAGVFVPIFAGVIVDEQYEHEAWTPFWLTTAAIMGCSGLIFLMFGETDRQNYSTDDDADEDDETNVDGRRAETDDLRRSGGRERPVATKRRAAAGQ